MKSQPTEIINQSDATYSETPENVRQASRAIVVRDGGILLTHERNTGVYMTPGGGLESGETLEECCVRELKEETGFVVKPVERFVTVNEFCLGTLYVSNYFICEVTGDCEQNLTDIEIEHGAHPRWLPLSEAIEIFATYESKTPDIRSLYLREYTVLNKFIEKGTVDYAF